MSEHTIYPHTVGMKTAEGQAFKIIATPQGVRLETNLPVEEAARLFFKYTDMFIKRETAEKQDLRNAQIARDDVGYIGTAADCIRSLDRDNEQMRLLIQTIAYEAKQEPNAERQARILDLAKKVGSL